MEAEAGGEGVGVEGPGRGEFGEQAKLDGAQQRLGGPEGGAELQDALGRDHGHVGHGEPHLEDRRIKDLCFRRIAPNVSSAEALDAPAQGSPIGGGGDGRVGRLRLVSRRRCSM